MALPTFSQLSTKIRADMDLIQEPFLPEDELLSYMNDAIADAETGLHTIPTEYSYFQVPAFLYLNQNQNIYTLPPDIYANKILKMFYSSAFTWYTPTITTTSGSTTATVSSATNLAVGQFVFGTGIPLYARVTAISGTTITLSSAATATGSSTGTFVTMQPIYGVRQYEVRKIRNLRDTLQSYPGDEYTFTIMNSQQESGGNQIALYPLPLETGPLIVIWYIRQVRRLTNSTSQYNVLELPQSENFLYAHVKWAVTLKTRNPTMIALRDKERTLQYDLMMSTLREMIADGNNKMQMDFTSYFNQEMELYY